MYIKLGQGRYFNFISVKELFALIFIPILTCTLVVILTNLRPTYKISSTLLSNQSSMIDIQRGSLKGLDRSVKRLIRTDHRQKKKSSVMEFQTKLATLKSWQLMEGFILEYNLKPKLYPKRWDSGKQQWNKVERGVLGNIIAGIFGDTDKPASIESKAPSTWKAVKILTNKLKIQHKKKSGLIQVSLMWQDPKMGAELVTRFVDYANDFIERRKKNDVRAKIEKIRTLLAKQEIIIMQKILIVELENQQLSLAKIAPEINKAFKVLVPAMTPVEPFIKVPKLKLVLLFILSSIFTFISIIYSRHRRRVKSTS